MSTRKALKLLCYAGMLGGLTAAMANAADFHQDFTGNLGTIVTAAGVPPTLPAGRPAPAFTGLGGPLSLVAPVQSAGVSSYQWFRDGIAIVGGTNDVLLRFTTTALG